MTETEQQIYAAVEEGLNRAEIEAFLGITFNKSELAAYNKARAVVKLDRKQGGSQEEDRPAPPPAPANARLPAVEKRFTKIEVEDCIRRHCGIVTSICVDLDCTVNQFWRAAAKYKLGDVVTEAKKTLVSYAEQAVLDALTKGDSKTRLDAAKFALKTLGRDEGWAEGPAIQQNITLADRQAEIKNIFGI